MELPPEFFGHIFRCFSFQMKHKVLKYTWKSRVASTSLFKQWAKSCSSFPGIPVFLTWSIPGPYLFFLVIGTQWRNQMELATKSLKWSSRWKSFLKKLYKECDNHCWAKWARIMECCLNAPKKGHQLPSVLLTNRGMPRNSQRNWEVNSLGGYRLALLSWWQFVDWKGNQHPAEVHMGGCFILSSCPWEVQQVLCFPCSAFEYVFTAFN